jgi:hypothetical protein
MGLNRWSFRVGVYAAMMTDVYPPFRLNQGGEARRVYVRNIGAADKSLSQL